MSRKRLTILSEHVRESAWETLRMVNEPRSSSTARHAFNNSIPRDTRLATPDGCRRSKRINNGKLAANSNDDGVSPSSAISKSKSNEPRSKASSSAVGNLRKAQGDAKQDKNTNIRAAHDETPLQDPCSSSRDPEKVTIRVEWVPGPPIKPEKTINHQVPSSPTPEFPTLPQQDSSGLTVPNLNTIPAPSPRKKNRKPSIKNTARPPVIEIPPPHDFEIADEEEPVYDSVEEDEEEIEHEAQYETELQPGAGHPDETGSGSTAQQPRDNIQPENESEGSRQSSPPEKEIDDNTSFGGDEDDASYVERYYPGRSQLPSISHQISTRKYSLKKQKPRPQPVQRVPSVLVNLPSVPVNLPSVPVRLPPVPANPPPIPIKTESPSEKHQPLTPIKSKPKTPSEGSWVTAPSGDRIPSPWASDSVARTPSELSTTSTDYTKSDLFCAFYILFMLGILVSNLALSTWLGQRYATIGPPAPCDMTNSSPPFPQSFSSQYKIFRRPSIAWDPIVQQQMQDFGDLIGADPWLMDNCILPQNIMNLPLVTCQDRLPWYNLTKAQTLWLNERSNWGAAIDFDITEEFNAVFDMAFELHELQTSWMLSDLGPGSGPAYEARRCTACVELNRKNYAAPAARGWLSWVEDAPSTSKPEAVMKRILGKYGVGGWTGLLKSWGAEQIEEVTEVETDVPYYHRSGVGDDSTVTDGVQTRWLPAGDRYSETSK